MRGVPRRFKREWAHAAVVGLVGPSDVADIRQRVRDYAASLQAVVDELAAGGHGLPIDGSADSIQAWGDLQGRITRYEEEGSGAVPFEPWLFAGSAYERGRQLVIELDHWRDVLDKRLGEAKKAGAPVPVAAPEPMPVPLSDIGPLGAMGFGAIAILVGLFLWTTRK